MAKKVNWKRVIFWVLMASLLISIAYIIIQIIRAPAEHSPEHQYEKIKGDYFLMLLQCSLGVIVTLLPSLIKHKWSAKIPNYMYVLYFIFLFCAIILGEVTNFYFIIPYWDLILHTFSGAMLGALGLTLVTLMNDDEHINIKLSPAFVALFAFCFAIGCGVIWEMYEYTVDTIMNLNMQKYALESGELLVGRAALADTMEDLIVDVIGAGILSFIGYFSLKKKKKDNSEDILQ